MTYIYVPAGGNLGSYSTGWPPSWLMGSSVGSSSAYPSRTAVLVIESPASDPLSDIFICRNSSVFKICNIGILSARADCWSKVRIVWWWGKFSGVSQRLAIIFFGVSFHPSNLISAKNCGCGRISGLKWVKKPNRKNQSSVQAPVFHHVGLSI